MPAMGHPKAGVCRTARCGPLPLCMECIPIKAGDPVRGGLSHRARTSTSRAKPVSHEQGSKSAAAVKTRWKQNKQTPWCVQQNSQAHPVPAPKWIIDYQTYGPCLTCSEKVPWTNVLSFLELSKRRDGKSLTIEPYSSAVLASAFRGLSVLSGQSDMTSHSFQASQRRIRLLTYEKGSASHDQLQISSLTNG